MSTDGAKLLPMGRVLKSNGTDGQLLVSFRGYGPEDIDTKEPVFIYFDGLPVPFFIDSLQQRGSSKALVHLSGIRSKEDADEVAGSDLYMRAGSLTGDEDGEEGLLLEDLPGWKVSDPDGKVWGTVADYEDIPGNPCLYIETADGQVMIPLHEDFILSVDEEARLLTLDLPEGLV